MCLELDLDFSDFRHSLRDWDLLSTFLTATYTPGLIKKAVL